MHWFSWRAHLVLCCKWSGAAPLHHLLVTLLSTYEWPFTLTRRTHHTKYGLILGVVGLTHWSHSLATAIPSIASAAQSDHDCATRPSLSPFPQPTNHLVRSARAGFPRPTTQLNLPSLHWQQACNAPGLPVSSFVRTHASINLSTRSFVHCAADLALDGHL